MSDVKFCSIGYHAQEMASDASAAYWDDSRQDYHDGKLRESFTKLAGLLGYTLTPIAQADAKAVA